MNRQPPTNNSPKEPDFKNGEKYKIAYKPARYAGFTKDVFDIQYNCPSCSCSTWIYQDRTGTKKLDSERFKFKCSECGTFFICNHKEITKVLGK